MEEPLAGEGMGIEETARLLGTSVNTIRRRIRQGALRAERVSRPQGYSYRVFLPPALHPPGDGSLHQLVETLRTQLAEKDRQIAALLGLLSREQGNGAQPIQGEPPLEGGGR